MWKEGSRLFVLSLTEPVELLSEWPIADGSLDVVNIGEQVAHLPHACGCEGDRIDGFVHFMQEAYRCLEVGGLLSIRAPMASHPHALLDPRYCRFFGEHSFSMFAKPDDQDEWKWDKYGTDFGVRFNMVNLTTAEDAIWASMEKIGVPVEA